MTTVQFAESNMVNYSIKMPFDPFIPHTHRTIASVQEGAGRKNESTETAGVESAGRRRVAQSIAERIRAVACRCWADDASLRPSFTDIICELDIDTM